MSTVAVIIPTWNMADTLERAVLSAADADEIHVVDDASTDDTQAVIARLPIKVVSWRWPRKSRCHVEALRVVYDCITCDHIIGMGADDVIYPGFVDAVRRNAETAVVLSDYDVVDSFGNRMWSVSQEVSSETTLTPEQMQARVQSDRNATESGIGSSLRNNVCRWLWDLNWARMGPHSDCIGYAAAACVFGSVLLPQTGAAYTMCNRSYGRKSVQTPEDFRRQGAICRQWMMQAGLDDATTRALARKRCYVTWQ